MTVRTRTWRLVLVLMMVCAGVTPARAATHHAHKKPKPTLCPSARYLVRGAMLIPTGAPPAVDAVVVDDQDVGIDSGCPLARGRVTPTTNGTRVVGTWGSCGPLDGVRLRALTDPACNAMDGVVRAKRHAPLRFFATRSKCGDGIVDVGGGEQCDVTQGCAPPATCTHDCRCTASPRAPTTTTTTTIVVPAAPAADQP
jgi:hypothetical protein